MSFYAEYFYAETYYGSDEFGLGPGGPDNLSAYQNNIETVVLYWTLNPKSASFHDFTWTVETDTSDAFNSPDLRTYVTTDSHLTLDGPLVTGNTIEVDVDGFTVSAPFSTDSNTTLAALAAAIAARPNVASATVVDAGDEDDDDRQILVRATDIEVQVVLSGLTITGGASQTTGEVGDAVDFVDAKIHKGIAVPVYDRLQGETRPMYWRVKGMHAAVETIWNDSVFSIPQAIDEVTRDASLDLMPDPIYKKDAGSNNYNTHWVFGKSIDDHYVADVFAENDIGLESVRDVSVQTKFGDYVLINRPQLMKAIDFRELIHQFWVEARFSPTIRSVRNVVRAALCVEPELEIIREDGLDSFMLDETVGEEVVGHYIPDDNFYQLITFDGPLVTGNTFTITVDGTPVATPFNTDSDTTMQDIATNLTAEAGINWAAIVDAPGVDADRVVVIQAADPENPPALTSPLVTGGASQATATPTSAGTVLPATVWDNVHLSGGVIVRVTNPLGAIVDKAFLQDILRKLVLANHPLYVVGIS